MILQALVKEYENLAENNLVPKRGWCQAKVSYAIDLNPNGKIKENTDNPCSQNCLKQHVFPFHLINLFFSDINTRHIKDNDHAANL